MGFSILPPGYRFSPLPEDAVKVYLKKRILNQQLPLDVTPTIDIFSYAEPRLIPFGEFKDGPKNEWHFFTNKRIEKPIQTTLGYWEEINEGEVQDSQGRSIGFMRQLVFKYSNADDKKDEKEWYIHEYRTSWGNFTADEVFFFRDEISKFVLCKVFCKEPFSSSSDDTAGDKEDDDETT